MGNTLMVLPITLIGQSLTKCKTAYAKNGNTWNVLLKYHEIMPTQSIELTTHGYGVVSAIMTPLPKGYDIEVFAGDKQAVIYTPEKPYDFEKFVRDRLWVFNKVITLPPAKHHDKSRIDRAT